MLFRIKGGQKRWCWGVAAIVALTWSATAGAALRPSYGGELVIWSPSSPQSVEPAQAWSAIEVLLANALGGRVSAVLDGPPQVAGGVITLTLGNAAEWPDGSAIDAKGLARLLRNALAEAPVSLPPFTFRSSGREITAVLATPLLGEESYLELPWFRLSRGADGGAFRVKKDAYEADPAAIGGRPLVDRVRVEAKQGRHLEPPPDGIALAQAGGENRPVFALPRPKGPARPALMAALATLNRESIAAHFVRAPAHVPDGWPIPVAATVDVPDKPVVIAFDAADRDLRTVAERLQILLLDRQITARIAAEDRATHFIRLAHGDYDLALVALPPAPHLVQAATLLRLAFGTEAGQRFWSRSDVAGDQPDDAAILERTATDVGAVLLYVEDGGVTLGTRVHAPVTPALWQLDLGDVWLAPASGAP